MKQPEGYRTHEPLHLLPLLLTGIPLLCWLDSGFDSLSVIPYYYSKPYFYNKEGFINALLTRINTIRIDIIAIPILGQYF